MRTIFEASAKAIELVSQTNIRSQMAWLTQPERLIGIKGSRGVGKTTLMLQYAKKELLNEHFVYISLDNLYFTGNSLLNFADQQDKTKHFINPWSSTFIFFNYQIFGKNRT